MNTEKMLQLTELDMNKLAFLVSQSRLLKSTVSELNQLMERSLTYSQIISVFTHYDLGNVEEVYEIFGGYVNKSFGVYVVKNGLRQRYFVRLYKMGIKEKEIELEHSLIDYSIANGLDIAAGLIRTLNQKTYVKIVEELDGRTVDRFFAVYDFLPGEDKYTWDNPTLNDREYESAAEVLATFHNAARYYDPKGRERAEPKIMELLPMLPGLFKEFAEKTVNSKFHDYYLSNLEEILDALQKIRIPEEALEKMLLNPIHSDFHPGNLKFKDNCVVGIFDFDWCKIDVRLFDIALALVYACSSWQDEKDGTILLDKCSLFLNSYQQTLEELKGLAPLNEVELEFLPSMMAAANIYLMNWTATAYYLGKDLNVYEYLAYLKHNVRLMKWLESHRADVEEMVRTIK